VSDEKEIVYGRIPVLECLKARRRRPSRLFVLVTAHGIEEVLAAAKGVPVEHVDRLMLDRMTHSGIHQGVVLETELAPVLDLQDLLEGDLAADAFVVILDSVEDPHNFGAIARSAAACGAAGLIFAKDRSAPISPTAVKAAAGAMDWISLIRVTNLARSIETLKKAGFWVAALDADADRTIWDADLSGRIALVVGNEGEGIRRLVREKCDFAVSIPLVGEITSLNASVSAGIALAECRRRRWVGEKGRK
jgi:23S rRNA (guanosine2251-2'-O)-methyltransferase